MDAVDLAALAADPEPRAVVFAKDQPEYTPLPALVYADGKVLTEWTLTEDERGRLIRGENLRLWIWKGHAHRCPQCQAVIPNLLQPVALEVTDETKA